MFPVFPPYEGSHASGNTTTRKFNVLAFFANVSRNLQAINPLHVSATFGTPKLFYGGEASYSVRNKQWNYYNLGLSKKMGSFITSLTL